MTVENRTKRWPTPMMKEWPFWRDGMSVEEYIKEYDYYERCMANEMPLEDYKPLWAQSGNSNP